MPGICVLLLGVTAEQSTQLRAIGFVCIAIAGAARDDERAPAAVSVRKPDFVMATVTNFGVEPVSA
jgi:hypothetical protein